MTQLGFYHLTRTALEVALPDLLGRTLATGHRAVVRCGSEARVAAVDQALWRAVKPDWLPHGSAKTVAKTGHGALQPIWLTTGEDCPNGARYLFLLDGVEAALDGWERVFDLFDGGDPASVAAARVRWSAAKAGGHGLTYWRETERGWAKG